MQRNQIAVAVMIPLLFACAPAILEAQAHFIPGVADIRDCPMPDPGLYAVVYNCAYIALDLADNNGNKVSQVLIGPPGGPCAPRNVKVDVKLSALASTFLWVATWKFLGGHYGVYVTPTFSNNNIAASLSRQFLQPELWLHDQETQTRCAASIALRQSVGVKEVGYVPRKNDQGH